MIGMAVAFALGAVSGGLVAVLLLCALVMASGSDDSEDRGGDYRPGGGWQ